MQRAGAPHARCLVLIEASEESGSPDLPAYIDHLEREWPGIHDRLCEPGPTLRRHIHVYVNRERAKLDTPVAEQSRVDVIAAISGG